IASVLQEEGYKVGLYTSPHYRDFRERIRINGMTIHEQEVIHFIESYYPDLEHLSPSFFELTFAMATEYFKNQQVDIAVWETGMGGRLDSTNIVCPDMTIITNISFDHTRFLGNTLPEIAREKAGIIKYNTPVIIGEKQEEIRQVFENVASKMNAPIIYASDEIDFEQINFTNNGIGVIWNKFSLYLPFPVSYQIKNLKTSLAVITNLKKQGWHLSDKSISAGIEKVVSNTGFQGRFQILGQKPLTIADSAHNPAGLEETMRQLKHFNTATKHFVLGMVNDKDIQKALSLMPKEAQYYFAKADIPRGLKAKELKKMAKEIGLKGKCYASVKEAFQAARKNASVDDLIFIGGSTFTVAEVI
ncbi:MAG: bifunctional folylpolyglutamate synthase/dihydrofolate synthase, partial [Bacteroidales bacterium]|nr:bifunctional folylpolyglutamate synthase/dihydrofolate synthase [Bacteroidales bacterium]